MFNPFLCGSFSNQEEDDFCELFSPCTTPKRSRKCSCIKNRIIKNPYANLGLDKFYALLAELEDKKQKIYTQRGSQGRISFICFVYSKSNAWKPIVVKAKGQRKQENDDNVVKDKQMIHNSETQDRIAMEASNVVNEVVRRDFSRRPKKNSMSLRHPYCYLPVMMALTLLFLVLYGRSFATVCTSLGWYLAPMIKDRSSSSVITSKNKKDYVRRLSEKNMANDGLSSPRTPKSASKSV